MPDPSRPSFLDSLPRVPGIGALRRPRSVPVVQQTGATECGLASLASVLAFHGRHTPVRALRDHLTPGRDGTTAADLLHLAERNGLAGRGLRVDAIEDLQRLQRGSILHWRFSHFVVLDRAVKRGLRVMDPGAGRRVVSWEDVSRNFTGVAVELWPTDTFRTRKAGGRG
ncbi:MAG: peptidase domain-containing ABC transporter, partial [Acidobacteria bacterium]|nr:peptidase domain-containing ABC transporter [Acidobacteriota bacterium]